MKWFKHMTASWDDEKLAALVGKGGDSGLALYGGYWRIAEIVSLQMEGKQPSCSVTYPVWRWSQLLFVRKSYLTSILVRLQKERLLVLEGDPNVDESVTVKMPNLLKYRDEYSKKSRHNQDNITPRTEGEAEGEGEKDKDLPDATHPRPVATQPDLPSLGSSAEAVRLEEEQAALERVAAEAALAEATNRHAKAVNEGIDRLFVYYVKKFNRNPKKYGLTSTRRNKARSRLEEREATSGLDAAIADAKTCIDNLAANTHNREGGYIDWTDQIFRSADEFEKRLNWIKPQPKAANGGTTNGKLSDTGLVEYRQGFLDRLNAKCVAAEPDNRGGPADAGLADPERHGDGAPNALLLRDAS